MRGGIGFTVDSLIHKLSSVLSSHMRVFPSQLRQLLLESQSQLDAAKSEAQKQSSELALVSGGVWGGLCMYDISLSILHGSPAMGDQALCCPASGVTSLCTAQQLFGAVLGWA